MMEFNVHVSIVDGQMMVVKVSSAHATEPKTVYSRTALHPEHYLTDGLSAANEFILRSIESFKPANR